MDHLSRKIHFLPRRTTDTAEDAAHAFFKDILPHHGWPDSIVSDRDQKFTSNFWKELLRLCGVGLKMASSQHPQTGGASEVMNKVVETI